jgi:hypothetical protein
MPIYLVHQIKDIYLGTNNACNFSQFSPNDGRKVTKLIKAIPVAASNLPQFFIIVAHTQKSV